MRLAKSSGGDASSAQALLDFEEELLAEYRAVRGRGLETAIVVAAAACCTLSDVIGWIEHARNLLGNHDYMPRFTESLLKDLIYLEQIPNADFRVCYTQALRHGRRPLVIAASVAAQLGMMEEEDGRDYGSRRLEGNAIARLEEALGVKANAGSVKIFISYEWGVALARALGVTPHEAGV